MHPRHAGPDQRRAGEAFEQHRVGVGQRPLLGMEDVAVQQIRREPSAGCARSTRCARCSAADRRYRRRASTDCDACGHVMTAVSATNSSATATPRKTVVFTVAVVTADQSIGIGHAFADDDEDARSGPEAELLLARRASTDRDTGRAARRAPRHPTRPPRSLAITSAGCASARIASCAHPSSIAMNASTFGSSDANAERRHLAIAQTGHRGVERTRRPRPAVRRAPTPAGRRRQSARRR